jgi:FKBP-type peptidyl-prolyl cis-trans isomerase
LAVLATTLVLGSAACGRLSTQEKKAGYAVGMSIGQSMKSIQDKIEVDQVLKGIKEQIAGKATLPEAEMQQLLMGLSQGQPGDKAKTGYAVGISIGKNVKNISGLIDESSLANGIKDQLAGKTKLDEAGMREALQALTQRQQADQAKQREGAGAKNKAEGEAYLAKNKAKAGVKVTASGL